MHVVFLWFFSFLCNYWYTHTLMKVQAWTYSLSGLTSSPTRIQDSTFASCSYLRRVPNKIFPWIQTKKNHHFVTSTIIKYYFLFLDGEKMDQECLTFTLLYEAKVVKGSLDFFTCPLSLLMFIIWHRLQPPNDWETHHKKNGDHLYNMITNQVLKGSMDIPWN